MHGVVSLLDAPHEQRVEQLWAEIERSFGVRGVYVTPFPHFSYHVARRYAGERLDALLRATAAVQRPFEAVTTGVGVFTGVRPVVYLPVVRSPELTRLHASLWPALESLAGGSVSYYQPQSWMPHITVSFGDVDRERLPAIVSFLNEYELDWRIPIDNFSLIGDAESKQQLELRYPFQG